MGCGTSAGLRVPSFVLLLRCVCLRCAPCSWVSSIVLFATGDGSSGLGRGPANSAADGASVLRPGVNAWFESKTARFSVSTPVAPEDVYDMCLESGRLELLRSTDVPGSPRFDARDYRYLVYWVFRSPVIIFFSIRFSRMPRCCSWHRALCRAEDLVEIFH